MSVVRQPCTGTKANGEPCGTTLGLSPAGLCLSHDPERAAAAKAMRAEGGRAAAAAKRAKRATIPDDVPPVPKTLADAAKYFAWLVNAGATGRMDARTVHECSFALKGFETAVKSRDLEERVKELVKASHVTKNCPQCGPQWAQAMDSSRAKA